ncbi:MAG: YfhO family protein [Candidatus Levybacteria bacterium]|nr:YfhO family protein [Candidatus Levybacteria bacterium]
MIKKYSIPTIFLFVTIALFWQFFFKGLHPFPGNLLLGWHEPWRSEYFIDGRIMLPNKPVADDVFKQIYPLRTLAIDIVKKLDIPLWNPYNGAGMPLLATLNNGFLDPFNILFFILPYPFAWSIYIIIQPAIIGLCTYLYCRKISLSKYASLFASFAFIFSGFVAVRIIFGMYGLAIALLPFLLWILESYISEGFTRKTYLLPFAIFTLIVSTQPQISLYILAFTGIYFLTRLLINEATFKKKIQKGFSIIVFFILGFGLAAVQILPTLELFQHAHVNPKASSFIIESNLLPLQHFISILIPNYFGNPSLYNYWGSGDYIQTIATLGLIPVFFTYWSIGKIRNKLDFRFFFFTSAVVTIALAIDWIVTQKIFSLGLPILSTGAPSRILFLSTFSFAILSGYGFEKWFSSKTVSLGKIILRIFPFFILTGSIFAITLLLYQNGTPCKFGVINSCRIVALRNTLLELAAFCFFLPSFFIFFILKKPALKHIITIGIFCVIIILGIYNANKFLPFSPANSFFPEHTITNKLRQYAGNNRVFGFGQAALTPNTETQLRLFGPQYYHPLYIARYRELLEYSNNGRYISQLPRGEPHIRSESNPNSQLENRRSRLLNILGVSHFIFKKEEIPIGELTNVVWKDDKTYIIKNLNALPRAYLVNKFELITGDEKILTALFDPSFDINNKVILEEIPFLKLPSNPDKIETIQKPISLAQYSENKITTQVNTDKNSLFVLSDNYYPGWKAYIDGEETKIYRANYTFRAIEVPSGKHLIIFKYQPYSFLSGIFISIMSLFTFGLIYFFRIKKIKSDQ